MNIDLLVRDNIRKMTPYSSARDVFYGKEGIFLDANESPFGIYNRYPDPYQTTLKKRISKIKEVDTENIFLGNGSDEVIDLLMRIFCRPRIDRIVSFTPTYGMYQVSAQIHDVEVISVQLDQNFQIPIDETVNIVRNPLHKMTFICSPNNPTGNLIDRTSIEYILNNTEGIVVIDEAYIDFAQSSSWAQSLEKYPNLVVLQTLSKAWSLAGIRIGMAFADKAIIDYLNKVKPPYNISSQNQKTAIETLSDYPSHQDQVKNILSEKERVKKALSELNIIKKIYPSDANFYLIEVDDADKIYKQLIKKDLIVRNRHTIIENCLRISIGTQVENNAFLKGLKDLENE